MTVQTAEFDGLGRRLKKKVSDFADLLDGTPTLYYYDGQRIIDP